MPEAIAELDSSLRGGFDSRANRAILNLNFFNNFNVGC